MHIYKFLLLWIQWYWLEDGYQILVTQLLSEFLDFGKGGRQWCYIWVLGSTKVLLWYLFSCSCCELNCVLQHSILIQRTIYNIDTCIMYLILIDQVIAIVYHTLYECISLAIVDLSRVDWKWVSISWLVQQQVGLMVSSIFLQHFLVNHVKRVVPSLIFWFWDIWGWMVYFMGKLIVLPVEMWVVHLGIYSRSFFMVKLLGQFDNT